MKDSASLTSVHLAQVTAAFGSKGWLYGTFDLGREGNNQTCYNFVAK